LKTKISYLIRKCIFNGYNTPGPGLLEIVYHKILIYELQENDLEVKSEMMLPVENTIVSEP
jgi:GxxExxY protein